MELSTTKNIKTANSNNDISNHPKLHGIISDLRNLIDDYNKKLIKSQELIIEIAKRLDEESLCERSKISQLIKKILKDKIQEGKISEKWIEECLPKEYKRKYERKEVSSLSKKTVSITNKGQAIQLDDKNSLPIKESRIDYKKKENDDVQTFEWEEAIRKQQQFVTGDQIFSEETSFFIPKEKLQLVNESSIKSNKGCYVKFDKNKILREVLPDIQ
jgi:hypothetical protein